MDIHRARFVPYPTSAISALAFSRTSDAGYTGTRPTLRLALGRANGNIEIWNPQKGLWVEEVVFPGNGNSVDGLAWTQDPDEKDAEGETIPGQQRLFSIASSPSVTEWDLATGTPKRQSTGNFSEVWCLAAQPRLPIAKEPAEQSQAQDLVAGCGDGTIVQLSTADGDLQFKRILARTPGKRARCMSIAYQNRDRIIVGFADSMIRVYDTKNGQMVRGMSLGVSIPGAPKVGLVWQVRVLLNGDFVSADSNGEVKFWDGKTYSLLQRIQGHESDCLGVVTSNDGKTIMSGSIDGRIAIYRQTTGNMGRKSWVKSGHKRVHSNGEVKTMAAFESKSLSMVVSGGSDAALMVSPMREYGKEHVRALPYLPHDPPVASAKGARLLVSWWNKSISIWRIARREQVEHGNESQMPRKLVAKIQLDSKTDIRAVAISDDGRLLAASTSTNLKVFQLRRRADGGLLKIMKLDVPKSMPDGARVLKISPNSKWLAAVSLDSEVHVARITDVIDNPKRLQILSKTVELERRYRADVSSSFKEFELTVMRMTFAPDSSVLVASDLAGHLDSWVLEGHEDLTAPAVDVAEKSKSGSSDASSDSDSSSEDDDEEYVYFGQHWADNPAGHLLPKLDGAPLVLTFRERVNSQQHDLVNGNPGVHATRSNPHAHSHELPHGQHDLLVITSKHQIFEFDVLQGRLTDWSKRNTTAMLPDEFSKIRDRVMGAVWDSARERLWLYGSAFVFMLSLGTDFLDRQSSPSKKRRKPKDALDDGEVVKQRKLESGAGGRVAGQEFALDAPAHAKESTQDGEPAEDDDDDEVDLRLTRIESSDAPAVVNGVHENTERRWWSSFKYRPILGMVPIEDDDIAGDAIEVVLVERPLWDAGVGQKI